MEEKNLYIKLAIEEAKKSLITEDVPVGAIVVKNGEVISKAHNQREKCKNAIKHAEIIAIDKACRKLKTWYLNDCSIYITLEPCLMCTGAIMNARVSNVYYGAKDNKNGSESSFSLLYKKHANHKIDHIEGGILEEECSSLIKDFFKEKRNK